MKSSKKEMKKRLLALLLCITMVMNGGISTFAEGSEQSGHTHTEACYTNVETKELVCKVPEEEAHMHGPSCYTENKQLTCAIEASEGHVHTEECVGVITEAVTGNVCQPEEGAEHTHTEECVGVISEAVTGNVCGLEESEGHAHGDECYTVSSELTCTVPETEGHKHVDECYHVIPAGTLVCTLAETDAATADETQKGAPSDICKCGNPECTCETCEEGCTCAAAEKNEKDTEAEDKKTEETGNKEETKQPEKTEYSVEAGEDTPKVSITLADAAHIPDEAVLAVDSVTLTDEEAAAIEEAAKAEGIYSENVTALDISFELEVVNEETGETTIENPQPLDGNEVNVAVVLPGIEADDEVSVYHLGYETVTDENGEEKEELKVEDMSASVNAETGAVEFKTPHFSTYVFVEEGVDPATVDVETAEIWEATLPGLTGKAATDIVKIAESQIGYRESEINVISDEDGIIKGYSRYNDWYGEDLYRDWSTTFVAFCLNYAGIDMPYAANANEWIEKLKDAELFEPAEFYEPLAGDVVFFDGADRVAIITEIIAGNDEEPVMLKVIEGDSENCVQEKQYSIHNENILGYGIVTKQLEDSFENIDWSNFQLWGNFNYFRKFKTRAFSLKKSSGNDNIFVDKTVEVVNEEAGEYKLTLEAYATGEVVETTVPLDIVLILDQSGSMMYSYDWEHNGTSIEYGDDSITNIDGVNQDLARDIRKNAQIRGYYTYGELTGWRAPFAGNPIEYAAKDENMTPGEGIWAKWDLVAGRSKAIKDTYDVLNDNDNKAIYKTRLGALVDAATSFVNNVKATGHDSRIAVVGFSCGTKDDLVGAELFIGNTEYQYSEGITNEQYASALQDVSTTTGYENVMNTLTADRVVGRNTVPYYGFEMAKKVFENAPSTGQDRKKVVVFFTDGTPDGETNAESSNKFSMAKALKDLGADVYSVSMYPGADTSKFTNTDKIMHLLSSNYPDATSITNTGDKKSSDYYLTASNSEELLNIFNKISKEATKTGVTIGEETILREVLSDYFDADESKITKPGDIKVYTSDYNGNGAWKQKEEFSEAVVSFGSSESDARNDIINVTGFSYKDKYIYEAGNETPAGGQKLIVEVPITVRDGFWGGNNVPTNEKTTALYDPTSGSEIEIKKFPEPEVNVPIEPTIETVDKTIYFAGTVTAKELVTKVTAGGLNVEIGEDGTFTPKESWMDDYATLNWTQGPFSTENKQIDNKNCGIYSYGVKLAPIYNGKEGGNPNNTNRSNLVGTPVLVDGKEVKDDANVHILVPTVTFQDSVVDLGFKTSADYYNKNNKVGEVTWSQLDTTHTNIPAVSGTEPVFAYDYTPASQEIFLDTPVDVTVSYEGRTDVASDELMAVTTFNWNTCETAYHHETENINSHRGIDASYEFWIHTNDVYELPSTGGMGTYLYTIGGVVLMMGTSLMIYKKKRKEVLRSR